MYQAFRPHILSNRAKCAKPLAPRDLPAEPQVSRAPRSYTNHLSPKCAKPAAPTYNIYEVGSLQSCRSNRSCYDQAGAVSLRPQHYTMLVHKSTAWKQCNAKNNNNSNNQRTITVNVHKPTLTTIAAAVVLRSVRFVARRFMDQQQKDNSKGHTQNKHDDDGVLQS